MKNYLLKLLILFAGLCIALPSFGNGSSGDEGSEVSFDSSPSAISYCGLYGDGEKGWNFAYFNLYGFSSEMYIRVQLSDVSNVAGVEIYVLPQGNNVYESFSVDEKGGIWIPQGYYNTMGEDYTILDLQFACSTETTIEYTVSVYSSQDISTSALVSTRHQVRFIPYDKLPQLISPSRLSGNVNEDIPLAVEVHAGLLEGKAAKILIETQLNEGSGSFSITGSGIVADGEGGYVYDISSLQSHSYSFQAHATAKCKGLYTIKLLDADGNLISDFSNSIIIPIEFSEADVNALKAMAKANPANKDLQDFIEKEYYKKDRPESSGYNVGVVWNEEKPSRVREFYIRDGETVTELDLSSLTALERVDINGTYIKSLDLSALTGLRDLSLRNTPLQFKDVTLPEFSSPKNFYCYGSTYIEATGATEIDEYNAYAASSTLIDLSAYAEVKGVASEYHWYKVDPDTYEQTETTMEASGSDGKFRLEGKPGEYYQCNITNPTFKNWTMTTPRIKIARDAATYSPEDIAGLTKLATNNPDVPQLQEFVDNKGWEHENWDSYKDNIRTNWSSDETGRLTHLYIELDWGDKPDTISVLDLSAFSELEYFQCERFMKIQKLDLTHNTKLKHLHVYSRNLENIDVSMCPDLEVFKFCTESIGESVSEYEVNKLKSINLSNCGKLKTLKLEHAHLTNLDLSSFKQLKEVHIENCQDLPAGSLSNIPNLNILSLPNTTQFGEYLTNLPSSIVELYLEDTNYALPPMERLANLEVLGVPANLATIDLTQFPRLNRLQVGYNNSVLTYSNVKNYRNIYYNGMSRMQLKSPSHPESEYWFENGDTIDLSSQAVINGIETVFLWVNAKVGIEEKKALKPVPDRPGVFVLDSQEEMYGDYYCKLMNPQFGRITDINVVNGWQIKTSLIHVETSRPEILDQRDVKTLAAIVSESRSPALQEWWESGAWQQEAPASNIHVKWNNEEPRRLTEIYLYGHGIGLSPNIDLSALDKLEVIDLHANQIEKLTLPKYTERLHTVIVADNPSLKSFIVTPYVALKHLDVSNTALKACDVTNNKLLTVLFLNGTSIPAIETTNPSLALQLEVYGVPSTTTSIDLEQFSALKSLNVKGSQLRFSGVLHPRQLEPASISMTYDVGTVKGRYSPYGTTLDYSTEMTVSGTSSTIQWVSKDTLQNNTTNIEAEGTYTITDDITPDNAIIATLRNDMFPGWEMNMQTFVYTKDGDANLDKEVTVQDVVATISYILNDRTNMIPRFGFAEADVNYDDRIVIADVIGIVNLIQGRSVTKARALRSGYEPSVELDVDSKGFLTISSPVAIAGIQLEFTGVTTTLPLLGEAAKFIQASTLQGDTLRMLAYTMDGTTLPSGKNVLMQLPAGIKLSYATFADAEANSLEAKSNIVPTDNELIRPFEGVGSLYNYPNPFHNNTTFCYNLEERASNVSIQIFSADGALVSVLSGLPGEAGANRYAASIQLPAGVYYYRLLIQNGNRTTGSEASIFIIK